MRNEGIEAIDIDLVLGAHNQQVETPLLPESLTELDSYQVADRNDGASGHFREYLALAVLNGQHQICTRETSCLVRYRG